MRSFSESKQKLMPVEKGRAGVAHRKLVAEKAGNGYTSQNFRVQKKQETKNYMQSNPVGLRIKGGK